MLYRRYVGPVYALAWRRTMSRDAAEDVTAATFERALARLDGFDPRKGEFSSWLFRIASNEAIDRARREARPRSARGQQALSLLAAAESRDELDAVERSEEAREVLEALATLRPRYQEALTLRYLADLDHADAAAALGCSKQALAVMLHRALAALRRANRRRAEDSSGGTP